MCAKGKGSSSSKFSGHINDSSLQVVCCINVGYFENAMAFITKISTTAAQPVSQPVHGSSKFTAV